MVKITALTNEPSPVEADLVAIVDNVSGTATTKKSTLGNVLAIYNGKTATMTNKTLTSPTLTTPALGTPASGTLTNCTFPTLNQNTTGSSATCTGNALTSSSTTGNAATVTTNANLTGDVTSSGNATTIATDAVDIAMLSASGTASSTTFLRGDNAWAVVDASPLTTKGDLYIHTGSANARLAAGTNGYYLKADSSTASGLAWAAVSAGGVSFVGFTGDADLNMGAFDVDISTNATKGTVYRDTKTVAHKWRMTVDSSGIPETEDLGEA